MSVVILDDSRSPAAETLSEETTATLRRDTEMPIHWVGRTRKAHFVERLVEGGVPPAVATFALFGSNDCKGSIGGNRNAALLGLAGQRFISSDDDVICDPLRTPCPRAGIYYVRSGERAIQTRFYPSEHDAVAGLVPSEDDVVTLHEILLGRDVQNPVVCFRSDRGEATRKSVSITLSGVAGDSGMPTGALFLTSTGKTRLEFLRNEEAYRKNRCGRFVTRLANGFSVSELCHTITTTLTGFDNRVILPPFLPCNRGEDVLFGATLSVCFPDTLIGYVPAALIHSPENLRTNGPLPTRPTCADILRALLPTGHASREIPAALIEAGKQLISISSGTTTMFREYAEPLIAKQRNTRTAVLRAQLQRFNYDPPYWAREIQGWIEALETRADSEEGLVPGEYFKLPADGAWEAMRDVTSSYGHLLCWWPAIFDAARSTRAAGEGLVTET